MIPLKFYAIGAAVLLVIGLGAYVYHDIYHKGQEAVIHDQEKKLDKLKGKTDAAKDDALHTTDPRGELRKFSRPDE